MNFEIAPKSTEMKLNWADAKQYVEKLSIDGKTGWRLPTKEELNEIYESRNDFEETWYWSSTENKGYGAWGQNMGNGRQYGGDKNYGGYYVRAIRNL